MWSLKALASRWFNSETFPQLENSLWICLSSLFQLHCSLAPPLPNFILVPSQVRFLRAFRNKFPACKSVHHHLFPREPVLSQILHKNKGKINNAHSKRGWGGLSQLTPNRSDPAMAANTCSEHGHQPGPPMPEKWWMATRVLSISTTHSNFLWWGTYSILSRSTTIAISYLWLLSTWNAASETKKFSFKNEFIFTYKEPYVSKGCHIRQSSPRLWTQ